MDPLAPLIKTLHADGRPRVWSLVITVFGDSVQLRGGRIPTGRLTRLLGRIGIETGAVRTALSRLAQDGWVESRKEGRTSSYALTPRGQSAFEPATARIFAAPRDTPVSDWVFAAQNPGGRALRVAGGWLWPASEPRKVPGFQITGHVHSQSANDIWESLDPAHATALRRLAKDLETLRAPVEAPLDALAARVLLVHRWRRLVLRWPDLPSDWVPAHIRPRDVHRAVADTYTRLTPAAEQWLDTAAHDMAPMPPADPRLAKRFNSEETP